MEDMNFEEMRNQIAILKNKLDKQDIINDRMMHQVITTKADNMKRVMIVSIICGLFVICMAPYSFYHIFKTSLAFVLGTDLMMIYCIVREFLFKRNISDKTLMNASLLDVAKKIRDFKVEYRRYTLINIPLIFIWMAWLFLEVLKGSSSEARYFFLGGLAVGCIGGFALGLKMYLRIQKSASDIIDQIEETK